MGRAPTLTLAGLSALTLALGGCGEDTSMTQKQIDALKHSPMPTPSDRQKVADAMAKGGQNALAAEREWAAKQDPAKLAKINAERASMGRPPLGGG